MEFVLYFTPPPMKPDIVAAVDLAMYRHWFGAFVLRAWSRFLSLHYAWQDVILVFLLLPIWPILAWFGQGSRGEVIWMITGALLISAMAYWEMHVQRWFWWTIAALFVVHLPIVWFDPLHGRHIFGATLKPLIFIDLLICYAALALIKKCFDSSRESNQP